MTEQNHHDPAELDKLAEKFTVLPHENPASDATRAEHIAKPPLRMPSRSQTGIW